LALKLCGNSALAKDAVQETFITAWLKIQQLKNPAAFESWLKKILRRHYLRSMQSNAHSAKANLPADRLLVDEINQNMDEASMRSQLYSSLAQLPDIVNGLFAFPFFSPKYFVKCMLVNFVDIGFLHFIKSCDGKVRRVIRLVDKVADAITFKYFLHFRSCL